MTQTWHKRVVRAQVTDKDVVVFCGGNEACRGDCLYNLVTLEAAPAPRTGTIRCQQVLLGWDAIIQVHHMPQKPHRASFDVDVIEELGMNLICPDVLGPVHAEYVAETILIKKASSLQLTVPMFQSHIGRLVGQMSLGSGVRILPLCHYLENLTKS